MRLSHTQKLRLKVGFVAASLVPGAVLAAPQGEQPPLQPTKRSAITQTVEGGSTINLQLQLSTLINGGRQTIEFSGERVAHFKLTNLERSKLPAEQRAIYEALETLAEERSDEAWVALKRILTSAGADAALMGRIAKIDRAAVGKVADYLQKLGLSESERKDGFSIAKALEHDQLIVKLGADPSAAQQQVADLLAKKSLAELNELRTKLGAGAIDDPHLQARAHDLRARVIDQKLVDTIITRAHQRGLAIDTPHLLQKIQEIGPRPEGEQARADWYRQLVQSQGLTWRNGINEMNVIGLRAFDVDSGRNNNNFNAWNDTMAFVWNDGTRWHVKELAATTDPGYKSYWDSPDANGDGTGDVAHLLPGQYPYMVGTHRGVPGAGVPEINVPVARDTNHDGQIQGGEANASIQRGDVGYGINIHWGPGYEGGGVGPYSLGCQVTVLDSAQFHAQVTPLLQANEGQMLYTLVDMERLA